MDRRYSAKWFESPELPSITETGSTGLRAWHAVRVLSGPPRTLSNCEISRRCQKARQWRAFAPASRSLQRRFLVQPRFREVCLWARNLVSPRQIAVVLETVPSLTATARKARASGARGTFRRQVAKTSHSHPMGKTTLGRSPKCRSTAFKSACIADAGAERGERAHDGSGIPCWRSRAVGVTVAAPKEELQPCIRSRYRKPPSTAS